MPHTRAPTSKIRTDSQPRPSRRIRTTLTLLSHSRTALRQAARRTPGISCEALIRSGLVSFFPLFFGPSLRLKTLPPSLLVPGEHAPQHSRHDGGHRHDDESI